MNVNFEVTDTKTRNSVCADGLRQLIILFTPDGRSKIVNDTKCIEQVKQIMVTISRIRHFVYDRGAYVLDVDVNSGVYDNDKGKNLRTTLESVFL